MPKALSETLLITRVGVLENLEPQRSSSTRAFHTTNSESPFQTNKQTKQNQGALLLKITREVFPPKVGEGTIINIYREPCRASMCDASGDKEGP